MFLLEQTHLFVFLHDLFKMALFKRFILNSFCTCFHLNCCMKKLNIYSMRIGGRCNTFAGLSISVTINYYVGTFSNRSLVAMNEITVPFYFWLELFVYILYLEKEEEMSDKDKKDEKKEDRKSKERSSKDKV